MIQPLSLFEKVRSATGQQRTTAHFVSNQAKLSDAGQGFPAEW
jgi:hypothetical protein